MMNKKPIYFWKRDNKTLLFCEKGWILYRSRSWYIRNGYLYSTSHPSVSFSRVLFNAPKEMVTDHINGDTLDNQLCNLRLATKAENSRNRYLQLGRSCYKGVDWRIDRKRWRAKIVSNGKLNYLGLFDSEKEAAIAYDDAARRLHGKFARTNFK